MNKSILIPALSAMLCLMSANVIAAGGHGGGGSSVNKSGKTACKSTVIKHLRPVHLASVAPGSEFSFQIDGIDDEKYVEVTAKKIPVEMEVEHRGGILWFKGKLPESLVNTAARVHIEVNYKRCPAEKGWLLKITE
ncbi:hypothetical protein bplSymb_SCF02506P004 [Bathymodiolus platifrons methanotrophic gill symbiont]|uniref:hypothetical protein n=1 Tax=Bathymodiolus platifrons methanotrophic gill symbiont TaxID=113268 RepID=UPI000B41D299|nr:hypothetical protein [Bathymodiolus platifrons methanotrophic gill symbiont]TXK94170.1 hypothetical protein BMR10_13920 [Methylococcaceae bacterium CS4]TXK94179.1 hypothetical protein BMR11_15640 [Methylococcaceae bacterium CS5]TXL02493.1 hypothetical protein BMR07_17690 [Methylococcaceae bacterium CS1]TXL03083.1 hypothetical protein BMR08_17495 [Methylococcaceae bacterium CS2]TXL03768.1 hypothetical protein BMR09_14175 [Methylococcaceae bacterium CS3]TXL17668.1 hypothetical protein BMR04_